MAVPDGTKSIMLVTDELRVAVLNDWGAPPLIEYVKLWTLAVTEVELGRLVTSIIMRVPAVLVVAELNTGAIAATEGTSTKTVSKNMSKISISRCLNG
jgi:hypothetical protein